MIGLKCPDPDPAKRKIKLDRGVILGAVFF
jgi:hypothetical protein